MKQYTTRTLRQTLAVMMVLLTVFGCCGRQLKAAYGEESGTSAQTILDSGEYFAQKRKLRTVEYNNMYWDRNITVWEKGHYLSGDKAYRTNLPALGFANYPSPGLYLEGLDQGYLMVQTENNRSGIFLVNEDGIRHMAYLPEGRIVTRCLNTAGADIAFVSATDQADGREYLYRCYVPDNTVEQVMEITFLQELMAQHRTKSLSFQARTNEDLLFIIYPLEEKVGELGGYTMSFPLKIYDETTGTQRISPEVKDYLEEEIRRHSDDPELQDYIRWVRDYGVFNQQEILFYSVYVTYNTRTGEQNIYYGNPQCNAYNNEMEQMINGLS